MAVRACVSLVVFLSTIAFACTPAGPGPGGLRPAGELSGTSSADDTRTLVIAMNLEPRLSWIGG